MPLFNYRQLFENWKWWSSFGVPCTMYLVWSKPLQEDPTTRFFSGALDFLDQSEERAVAVSALKPKRGAWRQRFIALVILATKIWFMRLTTRSLPKAQSNKMLALTEFSENIRYAKASGAGKTFAARGLGSEAKNISCENGSSRPHTKPLVN
jgi:hypothetical protein